MDDSVNIERYLCLSVDVVGYGRHDDLGQARVQADLIRLLDEAAATAGLNRAGWLRQAKGDEELSLIPPTEALPRVVGDFCRGLEQLLRTAGQPRGPAGQPRGPAGQSRGPAGQSRGLVGQSRGSADQSRGPAGRMRLRLAIDDGPALPAANGYTGQAVVGVSRLVNSSVLRRALAACEEAVLAVILSDGVFRDWVKSGLSSVQPGWFRPVQVTEKEFHERAWLWVPGARTHELDLSPDPEPKAEPARRQAQQSVDIHFAGPVINSGGHNVFGVHNG